MKFSNHYIDTVIKHYKELSKFKSESKIIDRQLKLCLLQEYDLKPNLKKIKWSSVFLKTKWWPILEKNKDSCIITGSVALFAFDMISRKPGNLDLIKLTKCNIPGEILDMQYSSDNINNNLIQTTKHKNLVIHLFHSKNEEIINHEGFMFQNPFEILRTKLKIYLDDGPLKHYYDIEEWLNKRNTCQHLLYNK